jgi:hypothetical protein
MSKQILYIETPITVGMYVPDKLDYWTSNGKRVNFRVARVNNPEYPQYTGIHIIIWILSIYMAWKKR